jgi:hypothetical protein
VKFASGTMVPEHDEHLRKRLDDGGDGWEVGGGRGQMSGREIYWSEVAGLLDHLPFLSRVFALWQTDW